MNPSRTFILRPVATALLTAGILLAGMVAYLQLPISALPQVDYPTIPVLTFYPGAGPDVMASAVTATSPRFAEGGQRSRRAARQSDARRRACDSEHSSRDRP